MATEITVTTLYGDRYNVATSKPFYGEYSSLNNTQNYMLNTLMYTYSKASRTICTVKL